MWGLPLPLTAAPGGPPQLYDPIADDLVGNAANFDVAWTKDYRAVLVGIDHLVPVANATFLHCRTSSDGGATFDAGAADYKYAATKTGGTQNFDQSIAAAQLVLVETSDGLSNNASYGLHADLVIAQPFDAKHTVIQARSGYWPNSGVMTTSLFYGQRNAAARVDAVRFLMSSGNIQAARFRAVGVLPYGEGA